MRLNAPKGVYPPGPGSSTNFAAAQWEDAGLNNPTGTLLEIEAGSGALSLLAKISGWEVTSTDIDPEAVMVTQNNAARNGPSFEILQSNIFEHVSCDYIAVGQYWRRLIG